MAARQPAEVAALGLPPVTLERLHPARPWKVVRRRFSCDLPGDLVYATHGRAVPGPVVPAALGVLPDDALERVRMAMSRLRDERGDVVGQVGVGWLEEAGGRPPAGHWMLLLAGEGSLHLALEPDTGRGVVLGGTGLYASAAGQLRERQPGQASGATWAAGQGPVDLEVILVLDR